MMGSSHTKRSKGKAEENNTGEGDNKSKKKKKKTKEKKKKASQKSEDLKNNVVKQPRGLHNFGNVCYINSAMQPLCQTHALHSQCDSQNGKITRSFLSMSVEMANGQTAPFDATELRDDFVKTVKRFDNYRQHDSHEYLRHFLDELRKEERSTKDMTKSNDPLTAVDKIFGGHLVTVYICKECDKHCHLFEPCLDISLPMFFEHVEERNIPETSKHNSDNESLQLPSGSDGLVNGDQPKKDESVSCCGNRRRSKRKKKRKMKKESEAGNESTTGNSDKPGDDVEQYQTNKKLQAIDEQEINYKQTIAKLITPLPSDSDSAVDLSKTLTDTNAKKHSRHKSPAVEKKPINLQHCLKHFSRVEQINEEYLCEDCLREAMATGKASEDNLKLTSATKQTLIFNPPAILTIHLKRFELLPGKSRKRRDKVEYPEYLDIAPYCSSQCLRNDPPRNNIWYSLYAVVVHSGSLESGHYKAYVKVREREENIDKLKTFIQREYFNHNVTSDELIKMIGEGNPDLNRLTKKTITKNRKRKRNAVMPERVESKWYSLNDSSVHEVRIEKVLEQEAYLLFYERVGDAEDNAHVTESNEIPAEESPEAVATSSNQPEEAVGEKSSENYCTHL